MILIHGLISCAKNVLRMVWRFGIQTCFLRISQVIFLEVVSQIRPDVRVVVEQPAQSFMFKTDVFQHIISLMGLTRTLAWMGYWGAPILKPTHLLSNFGSRGSYVLYLRVVYTLHILYLYSSVFWGKVLYVLSTCSWVSGFYDVLCQSW